MKPLVQSLHYSSCFKPKEPDTISQLLLVFADISRLVMAVSFMASQWWK